MSERPTPEVHSSDELKGWAWKYAGPSSRKFVLIALCQEADSHCQIHTLSLDHLGKLVCLAPKRVRAHLRSLITENLLERTQDRVTYGHFAVCRYQLRPPWLAQLGELNCEDCRAPLGPGEVRLHQACALRRGHA